jgi:cytochrome c oxidase cbb3-type subunit 4
MYKNVLQDIPNIEIWPIISFVIFFVFFLCLIFWAIKVDQKFISDMSSKPLDKHSLDAEHKNAAL